MLFRIRTIHLLVNGAIAILACATAPLFAEDEPARTDEAIEQAIAAQLHDDELLRGDRLAITVSDGIATLDGPVSSLYEQQRAARIASTIKGVRAVVNTTTIDSQRRPEDELSADVAIALARGPATELFEIEVQGTNGTVILTGTVDSHAEKLLAGQVAKDVRGVHQLRNELQVRATHQRRDAEIDAEITRRLEADVWVDQRLIRVFVDDGHVRLRGVAGTLAEKHAAELDSWVTGVKSVDVSELEVDWQSLETQRRQTKYAVRANYQIKMALSDAFQNDPRVNRFSIDIDVRGGSVVLSGDVSNLAAKRAAEQDAYNTVGVTQVDNRLRVVPPQRPDDALIEDLQSALGRDTYLSQVALDTSVEDGVAVLSGRVDKAFLRIRAEDIASRVAGILDVKNQIQVAERGRIVDDLQIKYGIKNRMYWSES